MIDRARTRRILILCSPIGTEHIRLALHNLPQGAFGGFRIPHQKTTALSNLSSRSVIPLKAK